MDRFNSGGEWKRNSEILRSQAQSNCSDEESQIQKETKRDEYFWHFWFCQSFQSTVTKMGNNNFTGGKESKVQLKFLLSRWGSNPRRQYQYLKLAP